MMLPVKIPATALCERGAGSIFEFGEEDMGFDAKRVAEADVADAFKIGVCLGRTA